MVQTKPPINTGCTSSAHCDRQQKKRSPSNEVAHLWRCLHKKRSCWGSSFGVHLWQKPSKKNFLKTGSLLCVCSKRKQQTSRRRVVESAAAAFAAGPKQVFRPQQPPDQTAFAPMQIAHTSHTNNNFTRYPGTAQTAFAIAPMLNSSQKYELYPRTCWRCIFRSLRITLVLSKCPHVHKYHQAIVLQLLSFHGNSNF